MPAAARAAASRLNPCQGKDGLDLAKCLVKSFLYVFILIIMTKAISATGAISGASDVLTGECNPDFWSGAGQLILGPMGANVSPWCQAWQQVLSLIYSAPGMYLLVSAMVGLFINTRLFVSMSAARYLLLKVNLKFLRLIFLIKTLSLHRRFI